MKKTILFVALTCMGLSGPAGADVLELKNGTILNGTYAGGSAGVVKFNTAAGIQAIQTSDIISLTFTAPAGAAAAPTIPPATTPVPATAPATVPAAAPTQAINIPAGTTLTVRMMDSVSSKNKAGAAFTTKLETDAGSVKAGAVIHGRLQSSTQAGRAVGRSTLDLRLTQIVVDGKAVPIVTSGYQEAGKASIGKAAKGAAAGAAIGAIAGDAGKGAAIGAVGGALVRGETVTIPPGTLLEFTLMQPVSM